MSDLSLRLENLSQQELEQLLCSFGDYEEQPVDIDTFIDDPQFLGGYFDGGFWPYWRPVLRDIFPTPHYSPYTLIALRGSIGRGKCCHEDTKIPTDAGILSISEIHARIQNKEKLRVLSEAGITDITGSVDSGVIAGKRIRLKDGTILRIGNNHRVRVLTPEFGIIWKYASDMQTGDQIVITENVHPEPATKPLPKDYAYFIGALSGDGHIVHTYTRSKPSVRALIGITIGKSDYEEQHEYRETIQRCFKMYAQEEYSLIDSYEKDNNSYLIETRSYGLGKTLMDAKFYYSEKPLVKAVPSFILCGSTFDQIEYLAGVIDTDGYISKGNREIEISSKSERFIYELRSICIALGLRTNIKQQITHGTIAGTLASGAVQNYSIEGNVYYSLFIHSIGYQNLVNRGFHLRIKRKRDLFESHTDSIAKKSINVRTLIPYSAPHVKTYFSVIRKTEKYKARMHNVPLTSSQSSTRETLYKMQEAFPGAFDAHETFRYILKMKTKFSPVTEIEDITAHMYDIEVADSHSYVVDGAVSHNTIAACTGIAYDIYKLLCLKNPQQYYNLLPTTKITFAIYNVTLGLATNVIWDQLEQMLSASSWFTRRVDIAAQAKKRKDDDTIFPKRIDVFIGSRVGHSLGRAIFSAVLSEANFDILNDQTLKSFNSLLARGESRFMGQYTPFKVWVDSSEGDKSSAVNQIVDSYKGKPILYVNQGPTWEPKMHIKDKYSGKMFKVYKGTDAVAPRVLTTPFDPTEKDPLFQTDPVNIMDVPVEHYDRFDADIQMALRDLAGIATTSKYKLIRHQDRLQASATMFALFPDIISIDFNDDSDQIQMHSTNVGYFDQPLCTHAMRFIHIDIALSGDRLGIACGLIKGFKEKTLVDPLTLKQQTESAPEYLIEWAFAIEAKPGQQIPLYKVRLFIKWLVDKGISLDTVSCDGFESADMLQMLSKMGVKTEEVSVDRTALPYLSLRGAINDYRISLPVNKLLITEIGDLELSPDGKKVDHSAAGINSKDVADAVCGVAAQCNKNSQKYFFVYMTDSDSGEDSTTSELSDRFW